MNWKYLIALLMYLATIQAGDHLSCIIEDQPKIRVFQTLVQYQANKLSFNPHEASYQGNEVTFTFDSIDRLPKNSFITYSSENIIKIDLSNKKIEKIDNGAFLYLFCLHHLDLSGNHISNVTTGMFLGLDNLRILNLSENSLQYLYQNPFINLKSIKTLDISHNKIHEIDKAAFNYIPTLEDLYLSYNLLKRIRYPVFNQLVNLKALYMDHNEIAILPTLIFSKNPYLEKLDFSGNGLVIFDINREEDHTVLRSVKHLNLSDNYLINLHVQNISYHFPNRNLLIDLNNNQFYCSGWYQYLEEFRKLNIKVAPGRNFSRDYFADGIACDTLNSTFNKTPGQENDFAKLKEQLKEGKERDEAKVNSTFEDFLAKIGKKEHMPENTDVIITPNKSPLIDQKRDRVSTEAEESSGSDNTAKGAVIGLGVIIMIVLILGTLDYVTGAGVTLRLIRRVQLFITRSSDDRENTEYLVLTPPT